MLRPWETGRKCSTWPAWGLLERHRSLPRRALTPDGARVSAARASVRVFIVHPRDPAAPTLGGIQTFLRDFIKYAPADFEISFVGTTRDLRARPVGQWLTLHVHQRTIRFLAVGPSSDVARSLPTLVRSLRGLALLWRELGRGNRILQVHRPYRRFMLDRHRGPMVQFIHLDLRDWPGPQGWPKLKRLYREFADGTIERMDRVFIVNETGSTMLRSAWPTIAERIEFLPVWYDADVFMPATAEDRLCLRRELDIRLGLGPDLDDRRFVLLAVRLTEIKRPLLAIEALRALMERGRTDIQMIVAGSGELLDAARQRARELGVAGRVHFLGDRPREEIAQLMQASDALLLTARSEGGGPRVVLEALACGLPVVSTSVVEVTRTVTHRTNGWLVDEATPEALADGLRWAIDQPRTPIAAAAVEAVRPFTAQLMLSGLYETYRAIAAASDPR